MHQSAGLVHVRHVERDAELQGKETEAALQHGVRGIEGVDLGAPPLQGATRLHLGPAAQQMVLIDLLAVGCLVVPLGVEIQCPQLDGIAPKMMGDAVQRILHHHHALRATEAAKGRVGLLIGAAGVAHGTEMRDPVGVVGVRERARHDTRREVEAPAGIGGELGVEDEHAAFVVEPHRVAIVEAVPLAGRHHVDLAWQAQLHRPASAIGRKRRRPRHPGGPGAAPRR